MRTLAVFADGTWNDPYSNTNISRLYSAFSGDEQVTNLGEQLGEYEQKQGVGQHACYLPGVGTKGKVNSPICGATGLGLHSKVIDGYLWLSMMYTESPDDKIALFGFSRGAYTVRSLAGMICSMGLMRREHALSADSRRIAEQIWWTYKNKTKDSGVFTRIFKKHFDHSAYTTSITPIHFLGVFDTVGALGIPKVNKLECVEKWQKDVFDFADCQLSRNVELGVQALALDEMRGDYEPCVWDDAPNTRQCWFVGVHCDVGGGYPEHGLSDIALQWMLDNIPKDLIDFNLPLADHNPDHRDKMHDECHGIFASTCDNPRSFPANACVHQSVRDRMRDVPGCNPAPPIGAAPVCPQGNQ